MKFMKLGTRPDTFSSRSESIRFVGSEVPADLHIQVQNCIFQLHKFPLLSKCLLLQNLYSDRLSATTEHGSVIKLPDVPGGAAAFELCAKFCYGIAITISPRNLVAVRCAADYLQMTDEVDKGNLAGKLEVFFKSCILRRWKDTLVTLQTTQGHLAAAAEELGVTGSCIDAIATSIIGQKITGAKDWWGEDIAELGVEHYWRIMIAVKSAGVIPNQIVVEALKVYAFRWLPRDKSAKNRVLLEKIVSLLPLNERSSDYCRFLLKLLQAANAINASDSVKMELVRRVGSQLEEAAVDDLLIPPPWSPEAGGGEMLYDVELVKIILDEFMLQRVRSPTASPPRSAEKVEFEAEESRRRSSTLRVAKLIDGYLGEIAGDANLPLEKFIELAEGVPDFARSNHDDLYKAIDVYLKTHLELDKNGKKKLCGVLDCKKFSVEASIHAAQNDLLPLRVVVQVLFFEQSRSAAMSGELLSSIRELLAKTTTASAETMEESWKSNISLEMRRSSSLKLPTLRMKLEEEDDNVDMDDHDEEVVVLPQALVRCNPLMLRAFCAIP